MKAIELFSNLMVGGFIALSVAVGIAIVLAVILDRSNNSKNKQDENKGKNN